MFRHLTRSLICSHYINRCHPALNRMQCRLSPCFYVSMLCIVRHIFRVLTDFVCLYTYEFWLSLCSIVRSSLIFLFPLFLQSCTIILRKNIIIDEQRWRIWLRPTSVLRRYTPTLHHFLKSTYETVHIY